MIRAIVLNEAPPWELHLALLCERLHKLPSEIERERPSKLAQLEVSWHWLELGRRARQEPNALSQDELALLAEALGQEMPGDMIRRLATRTIVERG